MLLFKTTPGELADRQTILELKIEHLNEIEVDDDPTVQSTSSRGVVARHVVKNASKINPQPFLDELELIQECLKTKWFTPEIVDINKFMIVERYDALFDQLEQVNLDIWNLEDNARILRDAPDKFKEAAAIRAAEVLFAINDNNDKRCEIKKQIDALWGYKTQEKLYDK